MSRVSTKVSLTGLDARNLDTLRRTTTRGGFLVQLAVRDAVFAGSSGRRAPRVPRRQAAETLTVSLRRSLAKGVDRRANGQSLAGYLLALLRDAATQRGLQVCHRHSEYLVSVPGRAEAANATMFASTTGQSWGQRIMLLAADLAAHRTFLETLDQGLPTSDAATSVHYFRSNRDIMALIGLRNLHLNLTPVGADRVISDFIRPPNRARCMITRFVLRETDTKHVGHCLLVHTGQYLPT